MFFSLSRGVPESMQISRMVSQALQISFCGMGMALGLGSHSRVSHKLLELSPVPRTKEIERKGISLGSQTRWYPLHGFLNRLQISCRTMAEQPDRARGGLPRFHVDEILTGEGNIARVEGDEFWHMTKVLRLKVNDRVELFDGKGGILDGIVVSVNRNHVEVTATEGPRILPPVGPNWHVAAAFCTLKGGRGEWLVEKCTELGARSLTPLMTERSFVKSGARFDRWERVAMAATKQCQRLHSMQITSPSSIRDLLTRISEVDVAIVAAAEAPPLLKTLAELPDIPHSGIIFIGPEGDFTIDELDSLTQAGAKPVGLGPRRLRVETATVALLAGVMLNADSHDSVSSNCTG